ncbi:hypothetical protein ACIQFP_10530 [Nocardiopsis alba]|uniref:hypothetical protein n=1 Tax=Nocardiopsis alba TaxID=53437 RepID=UPI00381DF61B
MRTALITVGVGLVLAVSACGGDGDATLATRDHFDAEDLAWPLTVDEARIVCQEEGHVIRAGSERYALTGSGGADGMDADTEIWADDPEVDGLKVDLGDLQDYADEVCGE